MTSSSLEEAGTAAESEVNMEKKEARKEKQEPLRYSQSLDELKTNATLKSYVPGCSRRPWVGSIGKG